MRTNKEKHLYERNGVVNLCKIPKPKYYPLLLFGLKNFGVAVRTIRLGFVLFTLTISLKFLGLLHA